jgi:anthranilate synthase component 2
VAKDGLPDCLEVTAVDAAEGRIMALRHRTYDVRGVQFHPESILTPQGKTMLRNWMRQ